MVQTVRTQTIPALCIRCLIEKPRVLHRIFFSICVLRAHSDWYASKVSFGDPHLSSYYVLDGPYKYFEAKGEGIFQGDVWVGNASTVDLLYSVSEILV